jgi:cytochrome c peroxidase
MHDGSIATLFDVVMFYFRGVPHSHADRPLDIEQLAAQSFSDMRAIVAFLESLTGSSPTVEPPSLPVE